MIVSFKQIPEALLVPGHFQEIDNSLAGTMENIKKALIIAFTGPEGTAAPGVPVRVLSEEKAKLLFGAGSPAAILARAFLEVNKSEQLYVLPVPELTDSGGSPAGSAWEQEFTVDAAGAKAGAVYINVNGHTLNAASVAKDASAADVAQAIAAAVNASQWTPVEAAATGNAVRFTHTVRGAQGSRTAVSFDTSEAVGVTVTPGAETPGTGKLTGEALADLFNAFSEDRYHYIMMDFNNPEAVRALAAELESRYGAMRQIGGRAFVCLDGKEAEDLLTEADNYNCPHLVLLPRLQSPVSPGEWAVRMGAAACRRLADDPSANTYGTEVTGLEASFDMGFDTRQALLQAGVSTWRRDAAGGVLIERLVSSLTESTDGGRDTSYLDIQVAETVDAIRDYINAEARKRYCSWKLARTDENFGAGAKVMDATLFKAFLSEIYLQIFMKEKKWCQDYDGYMKSVTVSVRTDKKSWLVYEHQPRLIDQFYIGTGLLQFK